DIEAVIGLGDLDRAETLLGRLEGWGRATGRPWTLATAARCRGLLLAARGDTSGAEQALQEALRHHQQLAMPFELGRTLLVIGQVQRRGQRQKNAQHTPGPGLGGIAQPPPPPAGGGGRGGPARSSPAWGGARRPRWR